MRNDRVADIIIILFIIVPICVKLFGIVDIAWVWVLAPIWIPITFFAGAFTLLCLYYMLLLLVERMLKR